LSTKFQKYLTAENGGGADIVANRASASGWETFPVNYFLMSQIIIAKYQHFSVLRIIFTNSY
jgi:hypothetical protein